MMDVSPMTNMASSYTVSATANCNTNIISMTAPPPPSPFFSPTTNALNQLLIQHAESIVDSTTETQLERVENGVRTVVEKFGSAFSSVKKRTLRAAADIDVHYTTTVQEEDDKEECGGEQTIVLDVAAAYMARLERDGLYDDDYDSGVDDHKNNDYDEVEEVGDSSFNTSYNDEEAMNDATIPQSPAVIAVEEDKSKRTMYEDSFYHDDNTNNNNNMEEEEDQDLVNDSYYIGDTAGFCSSKSIDDSSISETASEGDDEDILEDDDDTVDDKSCSLDLAGIEKIMNLDDTLPSVIPKIELFRSNSDVDLSGIEGVMNLDGTLSLDNCDEQHVITATDLWNNGETVQDKPSTLDIVPSSNDVDSSLHDVYKDNDDFVPSSNGHSFQDEPSFPANEDDDDDDDFVPSFIKQMISQQESQISSLLGSISNMKSTPCRIKKLEASLMGEEDEDEDLNEVVDMTNAQMGLTPVKRRLELVVEEELQIESAGRARSKQNALEAEVLFKSGLEPELKRCDGKQAPPCVLPESVAEAEATPSKTSLELEVDKEQDVISSPQMAAKSLSIAADSSEAPIKSPWLSFISKQSPLSHSRESTPTQPEKQKEGETVKQPMREVKNLDQMMPTESSEALAENKVPDLIRQKFADADIDHRNNTPSLSENVFPEVEQALESTNDAELRGGAVSDSAVHEHMSPICESETADEIEFNKSDQMSDSFSEDEQFADMQNSTNSDEVKDHESLDHSTSSAIGSVTKVTGDFQIAEPSLTGEEPTLECLRGAFLAAESKLEAESKVSSSIVADESHAAIEDDEGLIDSVTSDNKSDISSAVDDTFETANFSLGDTEKAVGGHFFFDAEDNMKSDAGNRVQNVQNSSECNLGTEDRFDETSENRSEEVYVEGITVPDTVENGFVEQEEVGKLLSSSFENVELTEARVTEKVVVKPDGDGNYVDRLDESTEDADAFPFVNYSADETQANGNAENSNNRTDSQSAKMSSSAADESFVDESMFMPNSSMEVTSPPLILEQLLPSGVAESHVTTPEEECDSEDGDDDEDFFPNRDLRCSSNVLKESAASITSSVADKSSQPASSDKHDVKDVITDSEKVSSSRLLSKVSNRKQTGASSASSKHRNRVSASAHTPALSSSTHPSSISSTYEGSLPEKYSSKPQHLRARIRTKKSATPIDGKENNEAERTSKNNSLGASKKASYSVERLERLANPRRELMAAEPSPVKRHDSKKVASINRLSRLAQPKRQSVAPSLSPVKKKEPRKASIDRLSRLAQPKRQSVATLSPARKNEPQKVAAGTPSFVRRSKLMSSLKHTSKSTEDMEQEAISQFKPFKAKPLNGREVASRFKSHESKPPRSNVAPPATKPKPLPPAAVQAPSSRLYQPSPRRDKVLTFGESQQSYLNNGLRSIPPLGNVSNKLTTPKPFALSANQHVSKPPPPSSDEIELQKKFKAKPYPFHCRHSLSFSQPKSSEDLELEECRKQFKALPLPGSVSTTRVNYSNTPYHIKAEQQYQMAMERRQRIAEELQQTTIFKARPIPRSTYEARKVLRYSANTPIRTVVRPPRLSLASRAEERKLFDERARELREMDAQAKESILKQQQEWEEKELKHRRMTSAEEGGMCFKAREIHIEYM
ncbi:hypothetical protein ACHAXM_010531 [Skeletonema potamos]